MACFTVLREEFRVKKFGFGDVYPARFFIWHWRIPPFVYLLYRFVVAVYVDFWLIYLGIQSGGSVPIFTKTDLSWGAFLTNWTYLVLAIYLTMQFFVAFFQYGCYKCRWGELTRFSSSEAHANLFPEISSEPWRNGYEAVPDVDMEMEFRLYRVPWYLIVIWVLFNVVSACALMVTIVFFAFLLPQFKDMSGVSMENVQLHLLNSVFVLLEHFTTAIPFRLLHVIYPIIYGLIYILFSLFYWIPDHKRVMYPNILDWNHPGLTVGMILLIGFVFIPILHSLFFIIYRIKIWIFKACH